MATNNPPSFRLPLNLPSDVHPAVSDALKNHDDAITDLQQAIPYLKSSIDSATNNSSSSTSSSSSSAASALAASDASETVILPSPAANVIGFVNNQTGVTAYTTLPSDYGAFIIFKDSSPVAVTLTGATTVTTPWFATFINLGTGAATLTPALGTINGAANIVLGANTFTQVTYDGTNFWCEPLGNVGTITGVTAGTGLTGGGTSGNVTVSLATPVSVADGGTGTATPGLVAGSNVTITGTWPNQTISSSGGGGGGGGGYLLGTATFSWSAGDTTAFATTTVTGAALNDAAIMCLQGASSPVLQPWLQAYVSATNTLVCTIFFPTGGAPSSQSGVVLPVVVFPATGGGGSGYSLGGTLTSSNVTLGAGIGSGSLVSVTGLDGNHTIAWTQGSGAVFAQPIFTVTFTAPRGNVTYPVISLIWEQYSVGGLASIPFVDPVGFLPPSATQYTLYSGSTVLVSGTTYYVQVSCP